MQKNKVPPAIPGSSRHASVRKQPGASEFSRILTEVLRLANKLCVDFSDCKGAYSLH
jgi:hypothetical protein